MSTEAEKRERALKLIVTLTSIVERTSTPDGERASAKARIIELRAKYRITEFRKAQPSYEHIRENERRQEQVDRIRREHQVRKQEQEARARQIRREEAQRTYRERMADKDRNGQPMTDKDRAEAQRDPLGWAVKQDKRTHTQKQRDMEGAAGAQEEFQRINDKIREQTTEDNRWSTTVKYRAVICSAYRDNSKAGNPMVTIVYRLVSRTTGEVKKFRGWYLLNQERGVKDLFAVAFELLGEKGKTSPVDQVLTDLVGKSCTVILSTYRDSRNAEQMKVGVVMGAWA